MVYLFMFSISLNNRLLRKSLSLTWWHSLLPSQVGSIGSELVLFVSTVHHDFTLLPSVIGVQSAHKALGHPPSITCHPWTAGTSCVHLAVSSTHHHATLGSVLLTIGTPFSGHFSHRSLFLAQSCTPEWSAPIKRQWEYSVRPDLCSVNLIVLFVDMSI